MIIEWATRALDELLRANIAAGLAILLVLAIRRPVRSAFGARIAYGLWLLPPLIAAASLLPLPRGAASLVSIAEIAPMAAWTRDATRGGSDLSGMAAAAWIAGLYITFFVLVFRQLSFTKALGELRPEAGGERRLFRASTTNVGPALIGALWPVIVIPSDFEMRFTASEQRVILAHERAHLAGGDAQVNGLLALARCLCWFNPLVHLAALRLRLDQELACDARVLAAQPGSRRSYAEAMMKTQVFHPGLPLGCAWPSRAQHPLKERIAMLKRPLPAARRSLFGSALLAALALGGGCIAWASQADRTPLAAPNWLEKPKSADLVQFYPQEALHQGLPGQATLSCGVAESGVLTACKVVRERPGGAGFGAASLQLVQRFRMTPYDKTGRATADAVVRIPIRFIPPAPPPQ